MRIIETTYPANTFHMNMINAKSRNIKKMEMYALVTCAVQSP